MSVNAALQKKKKKRLEMAWVMNKVWHLQTVTEIYYKVDQVLQSLR